MENDARRAAVAVEGHHPGALAGVGRGYPCPPQRVEQRGLAGLARADDRPPQWLVQPLPPVPQPRRCHRLVPVGLQGPVEEPADLRHHARLLAAVPALDRHGAVAAVMGAAVPPAPASPAPASPAPAAFRCRRRVVRSGLAGGAGPGSSPPARRWPREWSVARTAGRRPATATSRPPRR